MKACNLQQALRQVLGHLSGPDPGSDAQLLERFVTQHDEAAFDVLVQRHGPMVFRLCQRMVANPTDAEDVFQATFVVLARRAAAIVKRPSLASWLHGVARRVARDVRRSASRRQAHERPLGAAAEGIADRAAPPATDLRPILDEELARLPERYRAPIVLCYLEGRSVDETAAELGCPRGTVATRMSHARDLLRKRLAKRGLALSAAALTAQLETTAGAAIPFATLQTLVPAGLADGIGVREGAAILAKNALQAMFWSKARWVGICLACLLMLGTATVEMTAPAAKPAVNPTVSDDQGENLYVRWRFDSGPPKDIRVLGGEWTHRPGKPGLMVVPEAALLLPTRLPKRPVVVSVKMRDFVRRSDTGDFSVHWLTCDKGNLAKDCLALDWWSNKLVMKPGDRYNWYAMGRWTVMVGGKKIASVCDWHRAYPGDGLVVYLRNQVIEEIELRGLPWQDLPPEVRDVERAIKTLKNGSYHHRDAQGKVWDERGKLVQPLRQVGTMRIYP